MRGRRLAQIVWSTVVGKPTKRRIPSLFLVVKIAMAQLKGLTQVFLSLDDLPIVRRTMGVAQVFVLTLTLGEAENVVVCSRT
jgi:hypothetical protein